MAGVMQPVQGSIAVYELTAYWAPTLQRAMHSEPYIIRGFRSVAELDRFIVSRPPTMVVYDLTADPGACLSWLSSRQAYAFPTIILGSATTAELEPICREWGVCSFKADVIPGHELAALCRRWMRSFVTSPSEGNRHGRSVV